MMGFAVEMYFDAESERRVRTLWQALMEKEVSSFMIDVEARPHVSLAVLAEADPAQMEGGVVALAAEIRPFTLQFSSVGAFPTDEGVLFLAPVVTPALLAVHEWLHNWLSRQEIAVNGYYLPGQWVPHSTVASALSPEGMGTAVSLCCQQREVFGPVRVESVGLVEFLPVRPLFSFPLQESS